MPNDFWLDMQKEDSLPTNFAVLVCESVGLVARECDMEDGKRLSAAQQIDERVRLKQFQQMSITGNFEDALISYYGKQLTEIQLNALGVIFDSTVKWLTGTVIGNLLTRINDKKISNKDFAASIEVIIEQLMLARQQNGEGDLNSETSERIKTLTYKMAELPEPEKKKTVKKKTAKTKIKEPVSKEETKKKTKTKTRVSK